MPFRAQITPIRTRELEKFTTGAGFTGNLLINRLKQDLGDEATRIIRVMQQYPGETNHANYRKTGELEFRTLFNAQTGFKPKPGEAKLEHNRHVRTGQLGLAWSYHFDEKMGALRLIITNVAHDRPGNYYAGWVNGFVAAEGEEGSNRGRHQMDYHKLAGWANFTDELDRSEIAKAAQDTIDDYLRDLGLR